MRNVLGIEFLRLVNESGLSGWAQVYVRMPFDEVELAEKGALFGVMAGKAGENWSEKEVEIISFVDEFFVKSEGGGDTLSCIPTLGFSYTDWGFVSTGGGSMLDFLLNGVHPLPKVSHRE